MARRYYRVATTIWRQEWDDDTRLVALYLLTSPHRSTEGLFRMPLDYARTDLRWMGKPRRFDRPFELLVAEDFVAYDERAEVCLIVNALQYQAPDNPNQIKAAVKALAELPDTPLLDRFGGLAGTHAPRLHRALCEAFPNRFARVDGTLPEPLAEAVASTPSPSPSPLSTTPPTPPQGGRQRERDRSKSELLAWCAEHFPGVEPGYVKAGIAALGRPGHPPTAEAVAGWLDHKGYRPVAGAAA